MKLRHFLPVALFSLVPATAFAIGAIAVDDEIGEEEPGYGFSTGHRTKEAAFKQALKECRAHGNTNCQSKVWFQECGAYASSRKYYGIGWGSTQRAAEAMALKQCGRNSCTIKVSECED